MHRVRRSQKKLEECRTPSCQARQRNSVLQLRLPGDLFCKPLKRRGPRGGLQSFSPPHYAAEGESQHLATCTWGIQFGYIKIDMGPSPN